MTILSAQSIRKLCLARPSLISPFHPRTEYRGMSFGLGPATYDVRVAQSAVVHPSEKVLLSTIEYFTMPDNVLGEVHDKSTFARAFVTAFNTILDPGWEGYLTAEWVNLGDDTIVLQAGDPLVQIKFAWLDEPTELPYRGKYFRQPNRPVPAILLEEDVTIIVPGKRS